MKNNIIKMDKIYEIHIKEIWDVKEKIYEEVKKEGGIDNYFKYLEKNIKEIKNKLKKQITLLST